MILFRLVLAALLLAPMSQAAPTFDPALNRYLTETTRNAEEISVIAFFHNKKPFGEGTRSVATRSAVEKAMVANAQLSQKTVLDKLTQMHRGENLSVRVSRLWLVNALIITLPAKQLRTLSQFDDIRYVSANHPVNLIAPTSGNWATRRAEGGFTYGLEKIQLPALNSAMPQVSGEGIRIGLIDTGIDGSHPELKGRVAAFKDFISNKPDPYDDNGHGTHCAGTIGGSGAGGTNIGVAPKVSYVAAKFLSGNGSGSFAGALAAMQWMADPDNNPNTNDAPAAVSNSWGGGKASASEDPADNALCQAVAAWVKLGILPIFAAGNSGPNAQTLGLPGACPGTLTIGATDSADAIASFSSRGPAKWKTGEIVKPDVVAPGVKVYSSLPGGKYGEFSGTSMATPHVAGLAALLYQINPKASIETMIKTIRETTANVGNDPNVFGTGRVDALKAAQKSSSGIRW